MATYHKGYTEELSNVEAPKAEGYEMTEGHKSAIVAMFSHGSSVKDLAEWYRTDQATIREIIRPHVRLSADRGPAGSLRKKAANDGII